MTGIGVSGKAVQRVARMFDPHAESLDCLHSSVAAGGNISLTNAVLRATNSGLISANTSSATSATVYGNIEATTISGSTYSGTTSQIAASDRPQMPDWSTVFSYYRTNGSEIVYNNLPTMSQLNLGRNVGIESTVTAQDWTGDPDGSGGIPAATIAQSSTQAHGGSNSLRVSSRGGWWAGASQYVDGYVKPGQQYSVEAWVYLMTQGLEILPADMYITIYTKGIGDGSANYDSGGTTLVTRGIWTPISATLTAPSWSGALEYAFVKIAGANSLSGTAVFYVDDFAIRETTTGRFIYRQVLTPSTDNLYSGAPTNAQGLYWINCGGNKLVIERSRIKGTLLLVNPGAGTCVTGPISWSPAAAGYPALLVDADTASDADLMIDATNRTLSETENSVDFSQDADLLDIYPSEIQGLVVVEDDVTFQNNALIRGSVIVGGDVTATSGALEVVYQPDALFSPPPGFSAPTSVVGRPVSIRKAVLP
jgi:hypothetical protein